MMQFEGHYYDYYVVLADDHDKFRNILKRILQKMSDVRINGEAANGLKLFEFLKILPNIQDMAIIDISMPNLEGLEATSIIRRTYPDIKVLVLSMHNEKEYVCKGVSVGATSSLTKDNVQAGLLLAIEEIIKGGVIFPSLLPDRNIP